MLNAIYVADDTLEAVLAVPVWLVVGAVWRRRLLAGRRPAHARLAARQLAGARDAVREAIIGVDGRGAITDWSPGAQALFGRADDEILGRSVEELFDGAGAHRVLDAVEQGERLADMQTVHRDGELLTLSVTVVPSADAGSKHKNAVVVARDVGELEAATERSREAESMYRSLTEHLPVVTYVRPIDSDAPPIFVSAQLDRLVGYTPDEWVRDPKLFGRILHPDDRHRVVTELAKPPDPRRSRRSITGCWRGTDGWSGSGRGDDRSRRHGQAALHPGLPPGRERAQARRRDRKQLRAAEATATAGVIDRQRTVDFLARAAAVLGSSLDYRATINEVVNMAARELADWCIVDRLEEDGNVTRLAVARADPSPGGSRTNPKSTCSKSSSSRDRSSRARGSRCRSSPTVDARSAR